MYLRKILFWDNAKQVDKIYELSERGQGTGLVTGDRGEQLKCRSSLGVTQSFGKGGDA